MKVKIHPKIAAHPTMDTSLMEADFNEFDFALQYISARKSAEMQMREMILKAMGVIF